MNPRSDSAGASAPRVFLLALLIGAAITAALYAWSLALPFYSDDLVQIPWLRGLTFGQLWAQVSPYGYYRPLAFSVWLAMRGLGLGWTPAGLRLLNLLSHALAAGLAGWLAVEIDPQRRTLAGVFTAMLFAAYPFAYQALPWVSAFFYPLVVSLSLLAVIAYLRARRIGSRGWMALSLIAAALAPFAHENGALVGLLVVGVEVLILRPRVWIEEGDAPPGRVSPWPLAHLAIGAAFVALWFGLRQGGVTTLDLNPRGLAQNATILASGLSFPVAWLGNVGAVADAPYPTELPLHPIAVWFLLFASVALIGGLLRRSPGAALFCAAWIALSLGPALATMRPAWLADAPRFLYPAGAGASIAWGLALSRLAGEEARSKWIAGALAILAALPGAIFVAQGVTWLRVGTAPIRDAVEFAVAHPGDSLLLVNLPRQIRPPHSLYPYFDGGVIPLPAQVAAGEIVGAHTGDRRDDQAVTVGAILPRVEHIPAIYGQLAEPANLAGALAQGSIVLVTDYSAETPRLREAGRVIEDAALLPQAVATFEDNLVLWETTSSVEGGVLRLALVWESAGAVNGDPTVFVHVVDAVGAVVTQADGDPIAGLHPIRLWRGHAMIEDVRYVTLPGDGPYTITVGVWRPSTGERLAVTGGDYPSGEVPVGTVGP